MYYTVIIKLSIVVPMYNEADLVRSFVGMLLNEGIYNTQCSEQNAATLALAEYEIILVDDGSTDATLVQIKSLLTDPLPEQTSNITLRYISFSRNFGKEVAVAAGINAATGDAIISLDGDGQHPPRLIPQFIEQWLAGAKVVSGVRTSTKASPLKKLSSKVFYGLFNFISDNKMTEGETDYILIDKAVQTQFKQLGEHNRINRGLINWLGFKRSTVEFSADERISGKSTYSTRALARLAINSLTSLSVRPLLLTLKVGIFITFASFLLGLAIVIEKYICSDPLDLNISGSAIVSVFGVFGIGILLISQGIFSLYLSKVHQNTQNRPLYIVAEQS